MTASSHLPSEMTQLLLVYIDRPCTIWSEVTSLWFVQTYQWQKHTDAAQAVQQISQMAGATQLTAFLHCCGVMLNISGAVHVGCVVQHAPSSSLGIVAEHQAGAQGLFAVDQQGGCSWGLLQEGVAVCGGEDGLVVGAQGMQRRNLPCRQVT